MPFPMALRRIETQTASHTHTHTHIQCNHDIRDPNIRDILCGPKLESVLGKQNIPNPDIRETRI